MLYQYEYGSFSTYASDAPERKAKILPIWEQIDLQDYRLRQATYHLDEGLRNLRYAIIDATCCSIPAFNLVLTLCVVNMKFTTRSMKSPSAVDCHLGW